MRLSHEILDIAGDLAGLSLPSCAPLHVRLCHLAVVAGLMEARLITLQEFADERAGDACEDEWARDEHLTDGSVVEFRSIKDVLAPIVARAR